MTSSSRTTASARTVKARKPPGKCTFSGCSPRARWARCEGWSGTSARNSGATRFRFLFLPGKTAASGRAWSSAASRSKAKTTPSSSEAISGPQTIRERFFFAKTGGSQPTAFDFLDSQRATEFGLFVQDHIRWGNLVIDAGIRFDRYHLRIDDSAVSPRLGLAYYWEDADLLIRGSYDRIFQTPAVENLLLSTSAQTRGLDAVEGALPLPASRANFYEVGVRKPLGNLLRLDVNHYWRDFENPYDDDVFLNTGISFPISFQSARIEGTEVRLEMPSWRRLSAFVSYSNMLGTATSPVTGGLFIEGGEAGELRDVVTRFPITQDQRNTVSATARYEPHPRLWFAVAGRYGSGLPVELAGDDEEAAGEGSGQSSTGEPGGFGLALIPPAIIDRVNFGRGRPAAQLQPGPLAWCQTLGERPQIIEPAARRPQRNRPAQRHQFLGLVFRHGDCADPNDRSSAAGSHVSAASGRSPAKAPLIQWPSSRGPRLPKPGVPRNRLSNASLCRIAGYSVSL